MSRSLQSNAARGADFSPPVENGLECPSCGTVAVNRDFCPCGEYLQWELTTEPADTPAPAPPAVYVPPAPEDLRESTLLTLRDPARNDDPSAAVSVAVVPGTEVTVLATVRNQGQIVDTFDLRVDGLPDAWWTISPATVFLNPWGTTGDYEQEVQVRLHPPQTPESVARAWPFTVVARSRSRSLLDADVAHAQATLTVQPFQNTVMSVGPERRRGRRHAAFDVAVANHGNSPMEIVIGAEDTEARCPVGVVPRRTMVPVGGSANAVVRVAVPRPLIVGRAVEHKIEVTHRATGVESEPAPQRVMFRQKPWLPWWVPPVLALLAAFTVAILLLRREPEVPKLEGDTVAEAAVVLKKHHLALGRVTYADAPKGVAVGEIIGQEPAAGDDSVKGERVNVTLAAVPEPGVVPPVNGRTLAEAAEALTAAKFGYSPQPASAGNDWVVIRQDPTPGTKLARGAKVTLAVEKPAAKAKAKPTATPTPTSTPKAPATAAPSTASGASKPKTKAKAAATASAPPSLPADFVFAGATSGQLYRWTHGDAKAARLTSPMYRLETPAKIDDGYVAVHVADDQRRLVRISADGKTVAPIADGEFHRPAYSPNRGLLAVISSDGRGAPADAGKLCAIDPQDAATSACASASGRRLGRPSWAPNGRSLLVLAAGRNGGYDELLSFTATGGHATGWDLPASGYRAAGIQSAAWVGNDRVAVLLADRPGAPAHLRLLARRANGSLKVVKDFPALTGFEVAATRRYLALRRGTDATADGAMILLDVDRAQPRLRNLTSGVNPAWAG